MGYKLAIAGATTSVGREMLNILAEREFPVDEIHALGPRQSLGTLVSFGDRDLKISDIDSFDFTGCDIALFALDADETRKYAPRATEAGCVVIDSSPAYRMERDVPLIVPEANATEIAHFRDRMIIASPEPATAQLIVALNPLHDRARVKRLVVTSLQSAAGAGTKAMDELWAQTKGMYVPGQEVTPQQFPRQLAFNVIPQVGSFMEDGVTRAEWSMGAEIKKILDPAIRITATAVRVPVFVGDSQSVNVEFEDFLDEDEARDLLRESPGLMVVDKKEDGGYVTPIEAAGDFATFVSRIRQDATVENGLTLWITSDNLRKGSALNAVQIAEILGREHLRKG